MSFVEWLQNYQFAQEGTFSIRTHKIVPINAHYLISPQFDWNFVRLCGKTLALDPLSNPQTLCPASTALR